VTLIVRLVPIGMPACAVHLNARRLRAAALRLLEGKGECDSYRAAENGGTLAHLRSSPNFHLNCRIAACMLKKTPGFATILIARR